MKPFAPSQVFPARLLFTGLLFINVAGGLNAQTPPTPAAPPPAFPGMPSPEERKRMQELTAQDHQNMMDQLGITKLRPGPSGSAAPGAPNAANYDPALANPFPDLPAVLTLKSGAKVTTPEMWWKQRRPEIVEDFEREIFGRVPKNVPNVTWEITRTVTTQVGDRPMIARQVIGHVDNSGYPALSVDIKMAVVTPADAKSPVPILMMFGSGGMPDEAGPARAVAPLEQVRRLARAIHPRQINSSPRVGAMFPSARPASRRTTAQA